MMDWTLCQFFPKMVSPINGTGFLVTHEDKTVSALKLVLIAYLSRDMCFSTMWHFDMYRLRRACAASS